MSLLAVATRTSLRRLVPEVRALSQVAQLRFSADAAPQAAEDPILTLFRENQRQFRDFLKGLQAIPFPLSGETAAVETYADKVEALRSQVGARTVEDVVKEELSSAGSRVPSSLADLVATLGESEDPAAQRAYEGFINWAQDVNIWLESFYEEFGAELPTASATAATETELASGRLASASAARSDVSAVESTFWTKAAEFESQLKGLAGLLDNLPAVKASPEQVRDLVLGEYVALVEDARAAVADELAKADELTAAGSATLPAEVKPQLA